ncbi:metallophosphoesterase family protein [uncultured Roseobacter sp.]|uniref:metallophosphoesterase family protein n=1 Tax=uncultured Roseobacter sp. TaxID=114847 RepID=UPI00262C3D21|nr:metallophosphoesterase family protein [uncultured Roseobacter sp.]
MLRDLGVINGPVLLFGGPYSNAQATRALLHEAAARGIDGGQLICTGDIVAYGAAPQICVELIRQSGAAVVAGNCEKQIGAGALECGCGFEEGSTCDMLSLGWYPFARAHVDEAARAWMRACPDIVSFRHQGARYAVIHGGITDVARFIWPNDDETVFDAEWRAIEAQIGPVDHVIAGHCGLAFIRETERGQWLNPGVIGLPPHDGRQQTRFGLLDGGEMRIHRLRYDAEAAAAEMQRVGLTQGYDAGLLTGYWPSDEILPEDLRAPSLASG